MGALTLPIGRCEWGGGLGRRLREGGKMVDGRTVDGMQNETKKNY